MRATPRNPLDDLSPSACWRQSPSPRSRRARTIRRADARHPRRHGDRRHRRRSHGPMSTSRSPTAASPAIGPGLTAPPGTTEMDARGAWVVPGLIDVHVHLDTPMVFQIRTRSARRILAHTPRAFLYNGVTTVLNVSSRARVDLRPQGEAAGRACAGAAHLRDGTFDHPRRRVGQPSRRRADRRGEHACRRQELHRHGRRCHQDHHRGRSGAFGHLQGDRGRDASRGRGRGREGAKTPMVVHADESATSTRRALSIRPRAIIHGLEDPIPSGDSLIAELKAGNVFVAPTLSLWEAFNSFERHPERFDDPVLHGQRAAIPAVVDAQAGIPGRREEAVPRGRSDGRLHLGRRADENLHGQHDGDAQGGREDRGGHRRRRPRRLQLPGLQHDSRDGAAGRGRAVADGGDGRGDSHGRRADRRRRPTSARSRPASSRTC